MWFALVLTSTLLFVVGILFGLVGAGGGVLTIPVLVYVNGLPLTEAVPGSYLVVALSSGAGVLYLNHKQGIDLNAFVRFGTISVIVIALTRVFVQPAIPEHLELGSGLELASEKVLMVLFTCILLLSAYFLMYPPNFGREIMQDKRYMVFLGILVGLVTGLVGAGGGFIIVPALILGLGVPMSQVAGTSLAIICLNTMLGFLISSSHIPAHHLWHFMAFALACVCGLVIGVQLRNYFSEMYLKKMLAFILIGIAGVILKNEFYK